MSDADTLLKEPWSSLERQREGARFAMWAFIGSEILFFGALLMAYSMLRFENHTAFAEASSESNLFYGTLNTVILVTSSTTMAIVAQACKQESGLHRLVVICLAATAALGFAFLVVKGLEYKDDLDKHLWPGPDFKLHDPAARIFFALYWILTGVHAVHLSIGIGLVSRLAFLGATGRRKLDGNPQVEVTSLYWHFVDIIWVMLYPIIYLSGR